MPFVLGFRMEWLGVVDLGPLGFSGFARCWGFGPEVGFAS